MPRLEEIPSVPYLSGRCQRFSNIGTHGVLQRVAGRVEFGLGIRSEVQRLLSPRQPVAPTADSHIGAPSRFAEWDWVRVLDAERLRATLDAASKTRGLEFCAQQWFSCGQSYRVTKVVRRIIDDGGVFRRVSRTVLVDGVDCGGEHGTAGCGRFCPMMFRDEWLEPAAPGMDAGEAPRAAVVTVRSAAEIEATLDMLGRREGLLFMPEMAAWAGARLPVVRELRRVWELERWVDVPTPVYVLGGVACTGAILRADGPCDRRCHVLWHRDWLWFADDGQ